MPLRVCEEGHVPAPHAHPRKTAGGHGTHKPRHTPRYVLLAAPAVAGTSATYSPAGDWAAGTSLPCASLPGGRVSVHLPTTPYLPESFSSSGLRYGYHR